MSKSTSNPSIAIIICQDKKFEVDVKLAKKYFGTFRDLLDCDLSDEIEIPIQTDPKIFSKILEYYTIKYKNSSNSEEDANISSDPTHMSDEDKKFISQFIDKRTYHAQIFDLYTAAHYLDTPDLRHLVAKQLAKIISEAKSSEELRAEFNVPYISEQEKKRRKSEIEKMIDDKTS